MYRYTQIPILNNIQFVPETFDLPERYHYYPIDKEWYYQNLRPWQIPRPFFQPIQQTDKIYLEVHINNIAGEVAFDTGYYVIDCDGNIVVPIEAPDFTIYDSNSVYVTDDGTEIPMVVNKWNFRFEDHSLDEGIYRVVIRNQFYDNGSLSVTETRYWISEPILLKQNHPETIYIQAWNNTNKQDVIFQYDTTDLEGYVGDFFYTPKFGYRVYGDIDESPKPTRQAINFIEQDYEVRQLSAEGEPTSLLYIGGDNGIPFYMRDKINEALKCDNIFVEGRQKVVNDGADWDVTDINNALAVATIELMNYDRRDRFTDTKGATVDLFTIPSYPFYIQYLSLSIVGIITQGRPITDNTTRDAYLAFLNDEIADANDMRGEFQISGGKLQYVNGDNENIQLQFASILTNYIELNVTTAGTNRTFKINYDNIQGGVVWGDGTYENVAVGGGVSAVSNSTPLHVYAAASTYTVRLFHNDNDMTKIAILGNTFTGQVTGQISGNVPQNLVEFTIRYNPNLGTSHSLNLAFIARAATTIRSFNFDNNALTAVGDNVFASNPWSSLNGYWVQLVVYTMNANSLSVSEVNACIIDFFENAPHFLPGVLNVDQTPNAAPTGTALGYANSLSSIFGWVVTKDV